MMSKRANAGTITAGFGAAAAALYAAPEVQADVVNLMFSPSSSPWTSASTLRSISVQSTGGAAVGGFSQWNDSVGKSFSFNLGFASWAIAAAGEVINTSNFSGTSSGFYFTTGATGTIYIAFRATASNGGGVGWFGAEGYLSILVGQRVPHRRQHKPGPAAVATWDRWKAACEDRGRGGVGMSDYLASIRRGDLRLRFGQPA